MLIILPRRPLFHEVFQLQHACSNQDIRQLAAQEAKSEEVSTSYPLFNDEQIWIKEFFNMKNVTVVDQRFRLLCAVFEMLS